MVSLRNNAEARDEDAAVQFNAPEGPQDFAAYQSFQDGFAAALALSPERVPFAEWSTIGFHCDPDKPEEAALARIMCHTVKALEVSIRRALDEFGFYTPEIFTREDDSDSTLDWVEGFVAATRVRNDFWSEFLTNDSPVRPRDGIFVLWTLNFFPGELSESAEQRNTILLHGRELVAEAICAIDAHWKSQGRGWTAEGLHEESDFFGRSIPARSTKTGRNQPCPCGSGRKFKKCCASRAAGLDEDRLSA